MLRVTRQGSFRFLFNPLRRNAARRSLSSSQADGGDHSSIFPLSYIGLGLEASFVLPYLGSISQLPELQSFLDRERSVESLHRAIQVFFKFNRVATSTKPFWPSWPIVRCEMETTTQQSQHWKNSWHFAVMQKISRQTWNLRNPRHCGLTASFWLARIYATSCWMTFNSRSIFRSTTLRHARAKPALDSC